MDQMSKRFPRRSIAALSEELPFGKFIPNALTVLALCTGATAIRFALSGHWQAAVVAIVIAAVLDTLDGRIARLLGLDSKFGAQLDSLADLVSFGIAPSVLVYMWTLYQGGGAGWTIALVFCVCCAIRLARFNIQSDEAEDDAPANHFTGVPAPAAACLILLPMLFHFQGSIAFFRDPFLNGGWMAFVSILMVSRLPTLSLKNMYVPRILKAPAILFVGLLLACTIVWPWATLTAAALLYLGLLPVGSRPPGPIRQKFTRPPAPPPI
ncbi:MAG TPA: CDP-diacylglycerol--serine O-phosphatidyltransferase [Rhizomicrobium sp.]|jgi:CDP-diacylglycerol--serine O-phosphatidyltransferase|nr:CDP-diacylglycerol--serine O-phosphatidyltransferase [Rhizomicrobium sp.]